MLVLALLLYYAVGLLVYGLTGITQAARTSVPGSWADILGNLPGLVLLLLWQNVVLANAAYIKKELDAEATLSVMTRVVARMEDEERYVPGETAVALRAWRHYPRHGGASRDRRNAVQPFDRDG